MSGKPEAAAIPALLLAGDSLPLSLVATVASGLGIPVVACILRPTVSALMPACPQDLWDSLPRTTQKMISDRLSAGNGLYHNLAGHYWIDARGKSVLLRKKSCKPLCRQRGARWILDAESAWPQDGADSPGGIHWTQWQDIVFQKRNRILAGSDLYRVARTALLEASLIRGVDPAPHDFDIGSDTREIVWRSASGLWQYADPAKPFHSKEINLETFDMRNILIRGSAWWYDIFCGFLAN